MMTRMGHTQRIGQLRVQQLAAKTTKEQCDLRRGALVCNEAEQVDDLCMQRWDPTTATF